MRRAVDNGMRDATVPRALSAPEGATLAGEMD